MDYLEGLNEAQKAAVINTEGPTMVIAGAGSGKTRVLTYRIAHMLQKGVDPFSILSLTFTNKAAKEMKGRIAKIVGGSEARNLWMGTFHSVFARILRSEAEKLHYPSNFTIYDSADSKSLIKDITKQLGLDDKSYKPALVLNRISSAKNNLMSAQTYLNNVTIQAEDRQMAKPKIGEIYKLYEQRCFRAGAMDFDDLLFKTNILLRDFPEVLHKYQHRFKYLLVDEYQDTNYSQYLIVKKLAAVHENICVVGDDAQSIYAFRGANIQNILNFEKDYPDLKTFKLEQNYRSTKNIVNAANSAIKNNKEQLEKDVWTANEEGTKIKVSHTLTDNEEGRMVANSIFETKLNFQAHNEHFAILYRTNAQSRSMEEGLRKQDIPYKIYGGLSFYQRKEIKDLLAYCRLVINPSDEEAVKRVINYPTRGIGKTTIDRILFKASEEDCSLWDVIKQIKTLNLGVSAAVQNKVMDFAVMIHNFSRMNDQMSAYDLASNIAQSTGILKEHFSDKTPEGIARYDNIQELLNGIKEFCEDKPEGDTTLRTLDLYMQDIALLTDVDNEKDDDRDKVSLMTIHAAKGLEFPYVYLVGLEENLFPSQMALNSRADLEEERRLFYVAVTRAEKQVNISYASSRYKWGNLISCEPSRFIEEIDEKFIEYDTPQPRSSRTSSGYNKSSEIENKPSPQFGKKAMTYTKKKQENKPPAVIIPPRKKMVKVTDNIPDDPSFTTLANNIEVGFRVQHLRFGKGEITALDGIPPNVKATISFDQSGEKQLLLKFAKLKIIK
jgi:DNA helicase-2/ATP-dependent DNA helicase PcrA